MNSTFKGVFQWLAYGAALNEGRALFHGDREFGEWLRNSNLEERAGVKIHQAEQAAACWAEARARGGLRIPKGGRPPFDSEARARVPATVAILPDQKN